MGRFSLQAEANSSTLVYVFVKATTTPSLCFPSQRGCAGLCGQVGGLGVPTHARGGDVSCPSPAGTP